MDSKAFKLAAVAAAMFLSSAASANYQFSIISDGNKSGATAINDVGQILGYTVNSSPVGRGTVRNSAVWSPVASGYDVKKFDDGMMAFGINNNGHVVGNNGYDTAFQWNGSTLSNFDNPNGASIAYSINDSGKSVGFSYGMGAPYSYALAWDNGASPTVLNYAQSHIYSTAYAVNNYGQAVGESRTHAKGLSDATIWNNNEATILSTPNTDHLGAAVSSMAKDVNDNGQAIGYIQWAQTNYKSVLWDNTSQGVFLNDLDGAQGSLTKAINNDGRIVGTSFIDGLKVATLWDGLTAINLNSFLADSEVSAGWHLTSANDINNNGWIVGNAVNTISGEERAFLMTAVSPVPEPETYALMMGGLGLVGAAVRRKRSQI